MKTYTDKEIELIKAKAIQDYLLGRGANDEEVNTKIRFLELKESEEITIKIKSCKLENDWYSDLIGMELKVIKTLQLKENLFYVIKEENDVRFGVFEYDCEIVKK
jgi:hypothetical protein